MSVHEAITAEVIAAAAAAAAACIKIVSSAPEKFIPGTSGLPFTF